MIFRAINLWKKKFEKRSENEQFKDLALLYYGGKYKWGREVPEEVDCSGLICGVLTLMGYPIRVTANELMLEFFNEEPDFNKDDIKLVFFVSNEAFGSISGNRLAGQARHVGILMDNYIILHATEPKVCLEELELIELRYKDSEMVIKSVNWDAIKSARGLYGLDPELQ